MRKFATNTRTFRVFLLTKAYTKVRMNMKNKAVYRPYRRHCSQTTGEPYSFKDPVAIQGLIRYSYSLFSLYFPDRLLRTTTTTAPTRNGNTNVPNR